MLSDRYLSEQRFGHPVARDNDAAKPVPMKRVLLVVHDACRTGAPLIALRLARILSTLEGVELFILLGEGGSLQRDFEECGHVAVIGDRDLIRDRAEENLERLRADLGDYLQQFGDNPPVAAICNSLESSLLSIGLAQAGIPTINLVHEIANFYPADLVEEVLRVSKHVVYPARTIEKMAADWIGQPTRRGEILPQGLLDDHFGTYPFESARRYVLEELDLPEDTRIVLGCGTADWRKGLDMFVSVARQTLDRWEQDRPLVFVWVGHTQHDHKAAAFWAKRDIQRLGLEEQVLLIGEREIVEPYFVAAQAFLMTSRDDPFPCVVHEAMAAECAVIAFEGAGGIHEILREGCGSVVRSGDVEAMSRQLEALLSDTDQRLAIGRRARRRVRETLKFNDYANSIARLAGLPSLDSRPQKPVYFLFSEWSGCHQNRMASSLIQSLVGRGFNAQALFVRGRFARYREGGPLPEVPTRYLHPNDEGDFSVRTALERFLRRTEPGVLIPSDSSAVELLLETPTPRFKRVGWANGDSSSSYVELLRNGASWDRLVVPDDSVLSQRESRDPSQRGVATVIPLGPETKGDTRPMVTDGSGPALASTVCFDRWEDCLDYVRFADVLASEDFAGHFTVVGGGSHYPQFQSQLGVHLESGRFHLVNEPTHELTSELLQASDYFITLEAAPHTQFAILEAMGQGCIPIASPKAAKTLDLFGNGFEELVLESDAGGGVAAIVERLERDATTKKKLVRTARDTAAEIGTMATTTWTTLLDSCFDELNGILERRPKEVRLKRGVTISVPASKSDLPSRLLFALPKSGGTLLNNLFVRACKELGVQHLPLHDLLYQKGVAFDEGLPLEGLFLDFGYCYGVFRWLPSYIDQVQLTQSRNILLVRDPRDMMVSDYYSTVYLHQVPDGREDEIRVARQLGLECDIDDYVVGPRAIDNLERYKAYRKILDQDETRVYFYEEIIYDKVNWMRDMMEFCGWPLSEDLIESIVAEHDVIPDHEDPYTHIRQVHPGDYRRKLKSKTIRALNEMFGEAVSPFGIRLSHD